LDYLGHPSRDALNRDDGSVENIANPRLTGTRGFSVHKHRTGTAECLPAAVFRTDQTQVVTKNPEEWLVGIDFDLSRLSIKSDAHDDLSP
jgi:hypothetical protein